MKVIICVPAKDRHQKVLKLVEDVLQQTDHTIINLGVNVQPNLIFDSIISNIPDALILVAGYSKTDLVVKDLIPKIREYSEGIKIYYGGQFVTKEVVNCVGADYWVEKPIDLIDMLK